MNPIQKAVNKYIEEQVKQAVDKAIATNGGLLGDWGYVTEDWVEWQEFITTDAINDYGFVTKAELAELLKEPE